MIKVILGADHGGYHLKEVLKQYLSNLGYQLEDKGAYHLDPTDDYPDFVFPVAQAVAADTQGSRGIVIGRSGNGEAIAANKVTGVRAALATNTKMAQKAREHNDANILALGADFINEEEAKKIVKIFLETPFSGKPRHRRRIKKIQSFEKRNL